MSLPDFTTLRAGRPDCPSDLALDRLHAGELSDDAATTLRTHVDGCTDCTARLAERTAGFDALPGVDGRKLLAHVRRRADEPSGFLEKLRRFLMPLTLVAAAGVVVLVLRPAGDPTVEEATVRGKGGLVLHVFRNTGDHVEELLSGDPFRPGDRLRFTVDLPSEGEVAVYGVDPSGARYDVWPLAHDVATRLGAGPGQELPGAVALDGTPGDETFVLVQCDPSAGAPRCETVRSGTSTVLSCQPGCRTSPFRVAKDTDAGSAR